MTEEVLHGGVANAGAVTRAGEHVLRPSNRAFGLFGSGAAKVVTPAAFASGQKLQAIFTNGDGSSKTETVQADQHGRLTLTMTLGRTRLEDERRDPANLDGFAVPVPVTSVEIGPA